MRGEMGGVEVGAPQRGAGAGGGGAGVLRIRAYPARGGEKGTRVLTPAPAQGTNPASTAIAGYEVIEVKSDANGEVDLSDLARQLGDDVAAFMITVPNTLGNFEPRIVDITEMCHARGAQVYMDGANLNAILGVSENAVLNANYVMKRLESHYDVAAPGPCMHECVLSARRQKRNGVTAMDIAKRLLDLGFYAPSTYFPLIVEEALMIEPTETESKETLDAFCDAMIQIAREAESNAAVIHDAPVTTPVRRLDQTKAARQPDLRWTRRP